VRVPWRWAASPRALCSQALAPCALERARGAACPPWLRLRLRALSGLVAAERPHELALLARLCADEAVRAAEGGGRRRRWRCGWWRAQSVCLYV
jgi:hypothetical protein